MDNKPPSKKRIGVLEDRVNILQKQVRELRDILNVSDNWGSLIKEWIGRSIEVKTQTEKVKGTFKWADRYHIAIKELEHLPVTVVPKGAIQTINLIEE